MVADFFLALAGTVDRLRCVKVDEKCSVHHVLILVGRGGVHGVHHYVGIVLLRGGETIILSY